MNDFNQQYTGMPDCGCGNGRSQMPVWRGGESEHDRFRWPDQTPPPRLMRQPVMPPQMTLPCQKPTPAQMAPPSGQPMDFAARMEAGKFPLAMSYVPMQQWSRPSPLEEGFRRGTMFAELDLPFMMGRCR